MLIATVLSQNTNDKNSYKAYLNLKNEFKTWNEAINIDELELEELIKIAGLKKQKAKTIKSILNKIENDDTFLSFEQLQKLSNEEIFKSLTQIKGIGVKTVSCLLLFALGRNICPVDTHVHRVLNRIGILKTLSPDTTFEYINKNLPDSIAHSFHTNLIKLGREICKPANPVCSECPLNKLCKFKFKGKAGVIKLKSREFMLLDNV